MEKHSLQQDALELRHLNRLVVKAVAESDWTAFRDALAKYADTKVRIKTQMLENSAPKIHDKKAMEILQKISEGENLPADNIIAVMEKSAGAQESLTALDGEELEALVNDMFYSWFSGYEYIRGLYKMGSLVVSISVPNHLKQFVDEVKNCYAFQQYNAVYSLCRTILESSVRDICTRRKLIRPRQDNIIPFEEYRWNDLKNAVAKGSLRRQIGNLYHDLSSLIHGRKVASGNEAKTAFESTLKAVHSLYAYHGL